MPAPTPYIYVDDGSGSGTSGDGWWNMGGGGSSGGGSSEPVDPNNAMYRLILDYRNYIPNYTTLSGSIPQTIDTVYAPIQDGVVNTAALADCPTSVTAVWEGTTTPCYLKCYHVVPEGETIEQGNAQTKYSGETVTKTWHGGRSGVTYINCWYEFSTDGLIIYYPDTLSDYQNYRSRPKTSGTALTLLDGFFTREGYIQSGWTKTDGGAKQYDFGDSYIPSNNNIEFMYPTWEEYTPPGSSFTITIHPNGAVGEDIVLTAETNTDVTIPSANTYSRSGYHLSVWNEAADGSGSSWIPGETYNFTRGEDVELYAIWEGDEYIVYYADSSIDTQPSSSYHSPYYTGVVDYHEVNTSQIDNITYTHTSKAVYGSPFYTDRVPYPESRMFNTFDGWEADDGTVLTKADAWYDAYSYSSDPIWRLKRNVILFPRWDSYFPFGKIFFGGKYSDEFGIKIEEPPSYTWPEYSYTHDKVLGRSGDILRDNDRYENVSKTYKISAYDGANFYTVSKKVSEWLHRKGSNKYMRLEDSYEPDIYMMAVYEESNELDNLLATAGKCEITFNCMPQKYLLSGDVPINITQSGQVITNPMYTTSYPIITFSGTGTVSINGKTIEAADNFNIIRFETESFNGFDISGRSMNHYIYCLDSVVLTPGDNIVEYDGHITNLKITPRWWRV